MDSPCSDSIEGPRRRDSNAFSRLLTKITRHLRIRRRSGRDCFAAKPKAFSVALNSSNRCRFDISFNAHYLGEILLSFQTEKDDYGYSTFEMNRLKERDLLCPYSGYKN